MPQDVEALKIKEQFWVDVLRAWAEYNFYYCRRVDNQIILYNSEIKIGNKLIFWRDGYLRGLQWENQSFENGEFKSEQKVYEQYGLSIMRYNSLKAAIPKDWKDFFMANEAIALLPLAPYNFDMSLQTKISRRVYSFLAEDVTIIHNKYIKWRQELGSDFCQGLLEFGLEHRRLYQVTNVAKYRSFQYRLLQRALTTNTSLYKWGISQSPLCTFCNDQPESIFHLFCDCQVTRTLWSQISEYLKNEFKIRTVSLAPENIVLNSIVVPRKSVGNFVCLVTKQYIYAQRCQKNPLSFLQLKSKLKLIQSMEKYIAIKNGKWSVHIKKWRPLQMGDGHLEEVLV